MFIQGLIDQTLVDRLTPHIVSLQSESRDPITVFIDSRGGSTLHAEAIRRLLTAPDQSGSATCRIITAVTGRAASAAADLLSFGDYAIAYPGSSVFYHGVRYTVDDPLTLEKASEFVESLRYRNDLFAMSLARRCVSRFVFRYATTQYLFQDFRDRSGNQTLTDLECFEGVLGEKLSDRASRALRQARKRFNHYQYLVERVLSRSAKYKKFQNPKRPADFEEVVLREVIGAVAARNQESGWTFQMDGGLLQLNDDFLLLLEYLSCYDGDDLRRACSRWASFFLTKEQQNELKALEDSIAQERKLEMLKKPIRPLWLFFVALCHCLQEGEDNDLTATDAAWLGLIDEVIGTADPVSVRSFAEWEEPDPASVPEQSTSSQATATS
ncbi:MAG TPA: ATP-dependent Clp protease proteolytic subunit [Bryobacteraceae bacterium]|nr:ATP-dependent Clp protease proteolytic subunit [Bryobacteraceae bacterium]